MQAALKKLLLIVFLIFPSGIGAQEKDRTYVLRPNDSIRLSVYGEPELSVPVRILKTGQASLELIGTVEIGGLTVAKAEELIRQKYAKDFLVDPKVAILVDEYATDFISVIGAVNSPGPIAIPVSGHLDLASALATAGGLAPNADTGAVQLVRAGGGTSTYSLSAIKGAAGRTRLASGDRIIANESRFVGMTVKILGQVRSPGAVQFPIDGKLDLVSAMAMAGGVTELAAPKRILINRKGKQFTVNFEEISERGDRPLMLEPDDIINVPERIF